MRSSNGGKPVIGVCGVPAVASWGFWSQPAVLVAETYLRSVRRAGGLPLILPPAGPEESEIADVIGLTDGLLLVGGTDIDPERYGQPAGHRMEETVPERDKFELTIATLALQRDVPVLGICRGLQILNVATGGTLHQHLKDEQLAEHRPKPGRLDQATNHSVEVDASSLLGRWGLAALREVNSHHHQGVAKVGAGGRVVARSVPDGTVEAIEWPSQRFALGVQWHPEDPPMDGIFAGLVQAACSSAVVQPDPWRSLR